MIAPSDPRLLLAAASVTLLLLPVPAEAQIFSRVIDRITDPAPPFGPVVDRIFKEHQVGGLSLYEYLTAVDFEGCLQDVRVELLDGLDQLRSTHVVALENRKPTAVWRIWERKLDGLSPDGMLLVQSWLDSPEIGRRLYFCEDGLPPSWRTLEPDAYVIEAVTWFDVAAAERDELLRQGSPGDREQAVMELIELRTALTDRFTTTFATSTATTAALARMDDRLDLMWDALVEPHHFGFTPRARTEDPDYDPGATRRARPANPFAGAAIPDPRDVALRDRTAASWRRQKQLIDRDIVDRQARLDEAVGAIEAEGDPAELDRLVRVAMRIDAELAQSVNDLERLQGRVRVHATGRPWVDSMLDNGYRRRAVRRLGRQEQQTQQQRVATADAIVVAVRKGARPPDEQQGGGGAGGSGSGGVTVVATGEAGPGNWLAGLPMPESGLPQTAVADVGIPEGAGWVDRVYEGPLPSPSGVWSDDLVSAIRVRHPSLDDTDIRILLGLVREAYRELPSRAEAERAVWRSLASDRGLNIRGEESTLSDLYLPGAARADQPIVTFVLTLYF
ncbi:MAG: hypothetical protein GY898_07005 [Proteobacteria bacterium]|nr:hypothetical protein [Pseudomonadota bacterium]